MKLTVQTELFKKEGTTTNFIHANYGNIVEVLGLAAVYHFLTMALQRHILNSIKLKAQAQETDILK